MIIAGLFGPSGRVDRIVIDNLCPRDRWNLACFLNVNKKGIADLLSTSGLTSWYESTLYLCTPIGLHPPPSRSRAGYLKSGVGRPVPVITLKEGTDGGVWWREDCQITLSMMLTVTDGVSEDGRWDVNEIYKQRWAIKSFRGGHVE